MVNFLSSIVFVLWIVAVLRIVIGRIFTASASSSRGAFYPISKDKNEGQESVFDDDVATTTTKKRAESLSEAILKDMMPPRSTSCGFRYSDQQKTIINFTYESSQKESKWYRNYSQRYEQYVFLAKLSHVDSINPNQNWTIRIGSGGNMYSFVGPFGESVPEQHRPDSPWVDEVWQVVSVNNKLNTKQHPYFIHEAGTYQSDVHYNTSTGIPLTDIPFYSPNLGYYCSTDNTATTSIGGGECAFASWGQQAHVPTNLTSHVIYLNRYKDCGDGVFEHTVLFHNFGGDSDNDDEHNNKRDGNKQVRNKSSTHINEMDSDQNNQSSIINYVNVPWGGVRHNTLRDVILSNKTDHKNDHLTPIPRWGEKPVVVNIQDTLGYIIFAEDLALSESSSTTTSSTSNPCNDKNHNEGKCIFNLTIGPPGCRLFHDDNDNAISKTRTLLLEDNLLQHETLLLNDKNLVIVHCELQEPAATATTKTNVLPSNISSSSSSSSSTIMITPVKLLKKIAWDYFGTSTSNSIPFHDPTNNNDDNVFSSFGQQQVVEGYDDEMITITTNGVLHWSKHNNHDVNTNSNNNLTATSLYYYYYDPEEESSDILLKEEVIPPPKKPSPGTIIEVSYDINKQKVGKSKEDNLALAHIFGMGNNNKGSDGDNKNMNDDNDGEGNGNSNNNSVPTRLRVGQAWRRDYTVYCVIASPTINPGETFFYRQYYMVGRFIDLPWRASYWVNETAEGFLHPAPNATASIAPTTAKTYGAARKNNRKSHKKTTSSSAAKTTGRSITLYADNGISEFDAIVEGQSCSSSSSSLVGNNKNLTLICVGRTTPSSSNRNNKGKNKLKPLFQINCGSSLYYVGSDPYYFAPNGYPRRPYICNGLPEERPRWILLGFFRDNDCSSIESYRYNNKLCGEKQQH